MGGAAAGPVPRCAPSRGAFQQVGYNKALTWDGRGFPLEKRAVGSTKSPLHKGQDIDKLMAMLKEDATMVQMLKEANGNEPNLEDYGKALAVFQRHFLERSGEAGHQGIAQGAARALARGPHAGLGPPGRRGQ